MTWMMDYMLFNLWMSKNALLINFLDGHYVAGQLDNTKIIKHPNNPLPDLQKVAKVIETVRKLCKNGAQYKTKSLKVWISGFLGKRRKSFSCDSDFLKLRALDSHYSITFAITYYGLNLLNFCLKHLPITQK